MNQFSNAGKWGFINRNGHIVIEPQFDEVAVDEHGHGYDYNYRRFRNFREGLCAVRIKDKWGYIDKIGQVVIGPQFTKAGVFSEGLAFVCQENKYGYIDKSGHAVIPLKFDYHGLHPEFMEFSEGLAMAYVRAEGEGKWGYIDLAGNWHIAPVYTDAKPFAEGVARVCPNTGTGHYIDKTGELLFQAYSAGSEYFAEGLLLVLDKDKDKDKRFFFIDKTGTKIFDHSFLGAWDFSEGLAAVVTSSEVNIGSFHKYGYIDQSGSLVIPSIYWHGGSGSHFTSAFVEGRAIASTTRDNMWGSCTGIIDKSGNWICKPEYAHIGSYRDGFARAKLPDNRIVFIDRDGLVAIAPKFPRVNCFSEGLAAVST